MSEGSYYEVSYPEQHSYENGICTLCGHINTCEHTNYYYTHEWVDTSNVTYKDNGSNATHDYTAIAVSYNRCTECYEKWNVSEPAEYTEQDGHQYSDGVCTICGHANTCEHLNAYHITELNDWGTREYDNEAATNEYHIRTGLGKEHDYCPDCWANYNWQYDVEVRIQENHSYNEEGICTECNYACMHEFNESGLCTVCGYCSHMNLIHESEFSDWGSYITLRR